MQRILCFVLMMLFISGLCFAQSNTVLVNCSPPQIFVNSLTTGTFDPFNSSNQPILTNITITNLSNQAIQYKMNVVIKWNETEILNTVMNAKYSLQSGASLNLINRDLVTNSESEHFWSPQPEVSLSDVMNSHPVLRDALQAGFFPDGTLSFNFRVLDDSSNQLGERSFIIIIRNINAIFLTYPGRPLGQKPPEVNVKPVTFLWNTANVEYQNYRLLIKEFMPNELPTSNSIETSGRRVFEGDMQNTLFTEFLPFQNRHYYAWQVSTGLYSASDPMILEQKAANIQSNILKSEWYVFQYIENLNEANSAYQQLLALLNMLNNPDIQFLFSKGYEITGAVIYEGQVFTGKDAVDLVRAIIGREIVVRITDN